MSRSKRVPTYRLHKSSGQAVVTLPDGQGRRRDVLLGRYGTAESRAEYARVIAEWEAKGRRPPGSPAAGPTVAELIEAYWPHVEQHYRRADGTPTNEVNDYKLSLRPLAHLYGATLAADFGPLALKAVRQLLVEGYDHPRYGRQEALSRGVVNQRVGRIRRMFRWAVENERVPPSVLHGLQAVRGLERGRSGARETEPVKPVSEWVVEATLAHATPAVADMARLQLYTGMRPGEVVALRACDLDATGKVWLYRPALHKTAHRGHQRAVAIGPKGQEVVRRNLKASVEAYLFSPREAMEALWSKQRKGRKSKVQPSQVSRKKRKPNRRPGERYTVASYGRAIARAVAKANAARREGEPEIPHWHPHQLRHTRATELRREFGLDAARVVLGHRSPQVTEVYADLDVSRAVEVMGKIG